MPWFWFAFIVLVLALLALDLGVLNRRAHAPRLPEAVGWTLLWVATGAAFSLAVHALYEHKLYGKLSGPTIPYTGDEAALTYLTGFVLEKALSIDNLFVMVLIFRNYGVDAAQQHRVLFWGILGALVMRGGMILGGVWLITHFTWVMYLFGAYLMVQGLLQLKPDLEEPEQQGRRSFLERAIGLIVPIARGDQSGKFFVRERGRLHATLLFVALLSVEAADAVFALDSVPAVLTVSTDSFIVFTSNVFAILGLRALYFVIADMMNRFARLKYALAFILVFVGSKMMTHDVLRIPIKLSLTVILGSVLVGVMASLWSTRASATPGS